MPKDALRDTANEKRNICLLSCIDDHQIPPQDYEITGELFAVCDQIVLKCFGKKRTTRFIIVSSYSEAISNNME